MQIIPNNAVFKQSVLKPQLNKLNASIKIIAFSSAGYGFFLPGTSNKHHSTLYVGMKTLPFFNRPRLSGELKRLARENAMNGKPLSVLDDVVFKAMLTTDSDDSREALRSLLSACTRREVSDVQVRNNDIPPAHLAAKSARLDVHVTFNDG